jgi:dTDP-4-dehydrorhamnose reductase
MESGGEMKVAILGATGMLGSMVHRYLSQQPGYNLSVSTRYVFDAENTTVTLLSNLLRGHDYAINCIGIIKPRIDELDPVSVKRAIRVNSLFPHMLAKAAEATNCKVIQIATDCVYSGTTGGYTESSPHDATDVYGKTKSLGEVHSPNVHHLRCSIIGPELKGHRSLLDWFLSQPQGATVKGFTNHRWNGITTLAFAKICRGIMDNNFTCFPLEHIVPGNTVTKAELLSHFAYFYNRLEVSIGEARTPASVDRTLSTEWPSTNEALWYMAGYDRPYTIPEMVEELANYQ